MNSKKKILLMVLVSIVIFSIGIATGFTIRKNIKPNDSDEIIECYFDVINTETGKSIKSYDGGRIFEYTNFNYDGKPKILKINLRRMDNDKLIDVEMYYYSLYIIYIDPETGEQIIDVPNMIEKGEYRVDIDALGDYDTEKYLIYEPFSIKVFIV